MNSRTLTRDKLIELFDRIYLITNRYRRNFKSLEDLELIEKEKSIFLDIKIDMIRQDF